MGANNSTPQTVEIVNRTPIYITPAVKQRIDAARPQSAQETPDPSTPSQLIQSASTPRPTPPTKPPTKPPTTPPTRAKKHPTPSTPPTEHNLLVQRKSQEVEERQFRKTLTQLGLIGDPINWAKDCEDYLKNIQQKLIRCLKDYPSQMLRCSAAAKDYQQFVYTEQYKAILDNLGIQKEEKFQKQNEGARSVNGFIVSDDSSFETKTIK